MEVILGLAKKQPELESAFKLLYRHYRDLGIIEARPEQLWLTKRHMLPTNANIVATCGGRVIAAATLFVDSPMRLPLEDILSLAELRHGPERCAELSAVALDPEAPNPHELKLMLYRYAVLYSSQYLGISHLLSQFADPKLEGAGYFKKVNCDGREIFYTDLANLPSTSLTHEDCFRFPERKFYKMTDCPWDQDTFCHFFVNRTQLFAQANECELRALQNIYDFGDFAALFAQRRSVVGARQSPRYRRFSMNCQATIPGRDGPVHLQVLDVSLQGIRAYVEEDLRLGSSYVLQISVGVLAQSEVIAKLVWKNSQDKSMGFEVSSGDGTWKQLISHLEAKAA